VKETIAMKTMRITTTMMKDTTGMKRTGALRMIMPVGDELRAVNCLLSLELQF
jgi:hypothetical protein